MRQAMRQHDHCCKRLESVWRQQERWKLHQVMRLIAASACVYRRVGITGRWYKRCNSKLQCDWRGVLGSGVLGPNWEENAWSALPYIVQGKISTQDKHRATWHYKIVLMTLSFNYTIKYAISNIHHLYNYILFPGFYILYFYASKAAWN